MRFFEILREANVLNVKDIEKFVSRYAARCVDERAKKFFTVNARRWLLHASDFQTPVADLGADQPDWARTAFQTGDLVEFRPNADLKEMFEHLSNALNEVAEEQPALLDRVARLDPPAVFNLTNEFYQRRMASQPVADEPGVVPLITYPDGSRWVELTRPENLQHEGRTMGHCVATYAPRLGLMQIYSFRDARNLSHVTISAKDLSLAECKGKQNKVPVGKYVSKVVDFLNFKKFTQVSSDIIAMDIVQSGDGYSRLDLDNFPSIQSGHAEIKKFKNVLYVRPDPDAYPPDQTLASAMREDGFIKIFQRQDHLEGFSVLPPELQIEVIRATGIALPEETLMAILGDAKSVGDVMALAEGMNYPCRRDTIDGIDFFWFGKLLYYWQVADRSQPAAGWVYRHPSNLRKLQIEGKIVRPYGASHLPQPILRAILPLVRKYNLGLDPDVVISATAGLSPAETKAATEGIRIAAGTSISVPRNARALPDGLRLGSTLHLAGTEVEETPDNLSVGRDLILSGSMVRKLGVNTMVKRVLDLRDSLVEELPPGLTVGGKAGSRLDLRQSRITRIPDDVRIIPSEASTGHGARPAGGKIMVDDPDLEIPEHLQQYVEYKLVKPPKPVIKLSNGAEWIRVNDQTERKYRRLFPQGYFPNFCLIRNGECLGGIRMSHQRVNDAYIPVFLDDHWVNPDDQRRYADSQRLLVDRLESGRKV